METANKIPVNVYAEMTPNPATMKFVADKLMIADGNVADFTSMAQAKGASKLAELLFQFPFVKGVFIAGNFVTVTKTDAVGWDDITLELRIFLKEFMEGGHIAVSKIPEVEKTAEGEVAIDSGAHVEPDGDDETEIVNLLEEYVRPAVESDGGAIHFKSFKDGVVTVILRGACSGCPSSTATLKGGIETLLKNHLPHVKEVVAEEG